MIVPLSFIDTFKAQTATAQECDPNSVQLAKGSKGPKVIELQTDLTTLGLGDMLGKHGPNQVGIDGIFGDDTKKTVIKFQQDNGLQPDGIVGPKTLAAICSALEPVPPPPPTPSGVTTGTGDVVGTSEATEPTFNTLLQNNEPEEDFARSRGI